MLDKLKLILIYAAAFLLQCTVFNAVAIFGVTPKYRAGLTVIYSFFFEKLDGLVIGVIFGIIQDIFFGQVIGISALIYLLIGLLLKLVRTGVYRDNKILLLLMVAVTTLAYASAYWLLNNMMLQGSMSILYSLKRVPVSIAWNYVVLLVLLPLARRRKGFTV